MELPDFKYHPNPIATGSIVPSVEVCPVCRESRGYAYDGIPYGTKEVEHICPWCIADGSAHEKFEVEFTDPENIGGYGRWVWPVGDSSKGSGSGGCFQDPGVRRLAAGTLVHPLR